MKRIHKDPVPARGAFSVPGRPIHVGTQDEAGMVWYETGPTTECVAVFTGDEVPNGGRYVGSAVGVSGWMVIHVYAESDR